MMRFSRWAGRPRAGATGNIVALLVVLCLLAGGTAYAANTIGSADIIDGSVQGVDIKDRTIRAPDLIGAPWVYVSAAMPGTDCAAVTGRFCSDAGGDTYWRNYSAGYQTVRFSRDATNVVTLQGRTQQYRILGPLPTLFYLPVNYRPSGRLVFSVSCSDTNAVNIAGTIEISQSGAVEWFYQNDYCEPAHSIDLTGISFPIN